MTKNTGTSISIELARSYQLINRETLLAARFVHKFGIALH